MQGRPCAELRGYRQKGRRTCPPGTGYSRTQIALHWIVFGLIAQQFLFRDAMSEAWDRLAVPNQATAPLSGIRINSA